MSVPRGQKYVLGRKMGRSFDEGTLLLSDYMTDPFPVFDGDDDFTKDITDWQMDGNDTFGDCVPCADVHYQMSNAAVAGSTVVNGTVTGKWPIPTEVEAAYFAYGIAQGEPGPQPDDGCDIGTWLLWRMENTIGPLPKLGGFAQVPDSGQWFQGAIHVFGGVLAGILISSEAMSQAEADPVQPWTSTATDWIGGHGVPVLARNAQWGKVATWGFTQSFDWEWWRVAREETFVLFTEEQMNAPGGLFNGVQVAKLKADIEALKGTV